MTITTCNACDNKKILKSFPNSIPYCSKCGTPIYPSGIREATAEEVAALVKPKKVKKVS